MAIITLTTDLGQNDHYLGAVKGSIYSLYPEANVVDISHNVGSFNISEGAFILKNCFYRFPKGTVHVLGINPHLKADSDFVAVFYKEHYFIGANNGSLSLIFEHQPERIFQLDLKREDNHESFPLADVLVKAAAHLAKGGTLEFIGKSIDELKELFAPTPFTQLNQIRGAIAYVDKYGNALTNIHEDLFNSFGKGRSFTLELGKWYKIIAISKLYSDVPEGENLAIFSSSRLLEIAIKEGSASELMGLSYGSGIIIEFHDS